MKIEASRVVIKENVNPFSTIGMIKVILTLHPRLIMTILDPRPGGLVSSMVILNLGWRVRITVLIPPVEKGLLQSLLFSSESTSYVSLLELFLLLY